MSNWRPKYSRERISLVDRIEKAFTDQIEKLQHRFYLHIADYFRQSFTIDGSVIRSISPNINKANNLGFVEKKFFTDFTTPVLSWFAKRLIEINYINRRYFTSNAIGSIDNVMQTVEKTMLESYGIKKIDDKLTIMKGGWLHSLGDFKEPYMRIKQVALSAVRQEIDINDFKKVLRQNVLPDGKFGPIRHHFHTHATDTFAEYNRQQSKQYAERLGMRAYIFNGGIIDTTRPFCEERDGKVVIDEEIEKWPLMVNTPDGPQWSLGLYNPYEHVGGHNCRHDLDPITDKVAIRLRPDLASKWGLN